MTARRRILLVLAAIALAGLSFLAGALSSGRGPPAEPASEGRRILYYRSPMNPQETSPTPRKDPMGMDYVPVYADEAADGGACGPPPGAGPNAVRIDPRVVQEIGVTTEKAEVRRLGHTIRTVGIVQPDERLIHSVTTKVSGWIERLYVGFEGAQVRRGAPLAALYSPDLLATEREYLLALRQVRSLRPDAAPEIRAEAESLMRGARERLRLWDLSPRDIAALERRGKPGRLTTLRSPASGVVLEKEITAGSQVQPGMVLMRIADLRRVWVFAQIYPHQLPWIREGLQVAIDVPGVPGRELEGRIGYIQPVVSPDARTVEVRIQVDQPGQGVLLKPGMYSNVEIHTPVARQVVAVREQAIIRTGERSVAVIALGDGYFEPRDVELGPTGDGFVEVLEGIEPGELVVTSSQFLIDSESNLRTALAAMGGGAPGDAGHETGPGIGGSGAAGPSQPEPQQQPPLSQQPEQPPAGSPPGGGHGGHGGH